MREAVAAICAGACRRTPIEILPGKPWSRSSRRLQQGTAVRELMTYPPFAGRRPIFIGDDITDESAFAVLPDFDGLPISVGRKVPGVELCFDGPTRRAPVARAIIPKATLLAAS